MNDNSNRNSKSVIGNDSFPVIDKRLFLPTSKDEMDMLGWSQADMKAQTIHRADDLLPADAQCRYAQAAAHARRRGGQGRRILLQRRQESSLRPDVSHHLPG